MTRVALYWAPALSDPLWEAGCAWLGRDPELGCDVAQPEGLEEVTRAPRVYGFHATLRPPMRLATGWEEFIGAAHALAGGRAAFAMPELEVLEIGGFLALGERVPCRALRELADACVAETDRHRLRADAAELAKRRAAGLSAHEDEMLLRWGYPYVMDAWRFHVTLSRRLSAGEMRVVRPRAEAHFAAALAVRRRVEGIAVFTQLGTRPMLLAERIGFRKSLLF